MNIFDAVAIVTIGIWSVIGVVRGFLYKFLEIVILLVSAGAAYLYYKNGGSLLEITLTFAFTNIVLLVALWSTRKMLFKDNTEVSLFSRFAGGAIGILEGVVSVLLVLAFLHLLNGVFGASNPAIAKILDTSFLYSRYKAISMASNIPAVKKVYRIGEVLKEKEGKIVLDEQTASKLRENASIKAILADEQLVEDIKQRNYGEIISNPKFFSILNDKELLKQLLAIGLQADAPTVTGEKEIQLIVPQSKQADNRLAGIVHAQGSSVAIINNEIYQVGSQVFGGKIIEITPTSLTMEFPDSRKQYSIGDEIP